MLAATTWKRGYSRYTCVCFVEFSLRRAKKSCARIERVRAAGEGKFLRLENLKILLQSSSVRRSVKLILSELLQVSFILMYKASRQ